MPKIPPTSKFYFDTLVSHRWSVISGFCHVKMGLQLLCDTKKKVYFAIEDPSAVVLCDCRSYEG